MIHRYPSRADWLASRTDRIGASEIWPLLNAPALFLQRRAVPTEDSDVLRRGRALEPAIGELFSMTTNREALPPWKQYGEPQGTIIVETHDEHPWAAATMDFYTTDGTRCGVVETKSQRSRAEWSGTDEQIADVSALAEGIAPAPYVLQCYWQMGVTGADFADLVALLPNFDLRVIRIDADPDFQSELLERAADARDRYLVRGECPPIDGTRECAALLARRFPAEGKTVRQATRAEVALLDRFATAQAEAEAAKTRAAILRNQVLSCIGTSYGIQGGGRRAIAPAMQRESFRLSEVPDDVRRLLEERGLIGQGKESRQVRLT